MLQYQDVILEYLNKILIKCYLGFIFDYNDIISYLLKIYPVSYFINMFHKKTVF